MKKIMYEDCNNNSFILQEIFNEIPSFVSEDVKWRISNVELIPIDSGDSINGILNEDRMKVYEFQKKIQDEHIIILSHNELLDVIKNTKTVYEGTFIAQTEETNKIEVFDGDIIELEGRIESYNYCKSKTIY